MLLAVIVANAQRERNVVYQCVRGNMTYTEPQKKSETASQTVGRIIGTMLQAAAGTASEVTDMPEYADAVKEAILGAVGSARRVRMIDGTFASTGAEGERTLVCDASISAITYSQHTKVWEDKDKKKHETIEYRGNVTGTVNLKDAATGEIVFTKTINSSSWADEWFDAPAKAIGHTISQMKSSLRRSINLTFPLYASIVEGARDKKDKAKEVYIDLGEPDGCYEGMHFSVYIVRTVAGKEAKACIGKLKVTEVMGDEVSLCKVQKGGADIKAALDAGTKLLIMSED